MAKKKKMTKAERKEARLRKGKQWLLTYTGSPKKMNKHYRERFHVDAVTAAKDLQELGVNYTQEQLDQIKQAEEQRLQQRRMEREAKERERLAELYEDSDDRFAFIAGYTDGGAPFGVMWEEVGTDQGLPFEETVCLLSKLNVDHHIEVEIKMDELDLTAAEKKATYEEIKVYVFKHTGLKVSSLYIAQVKQKYGIIECENYNKPKSENAKQPQCPHDKEKAIKEALLHFGMI